MTVKAPPLSDEERRCCEEIISDFANTGMPSYGLARAATVAHALERLTTSLERCREALTLSENALACFLETPEFVVTVGGNPIVVDGMLSMSRTALTKTRAALSLTKKE